ncbi:MAG: universal stress protein [Microbacteriaceae bacterium]|nr:universal stress protein [Microbacteriaceae bacterium]
MIERTIVGVDGSAKSNVALEWALGRERFRRGSIVLVRIVDDTIMAGDYLVTERTIDAARDALSSQLTDVRRRHPGLTIGSELVQGDPSTELARFSEATSLLVVGTRKRTGSRLRYAWSVGTRLATKAKGPVAIIPEGEVSTSADVVVAVDGSVGSITAVQFAAAEAAHAGGVLRAIHAWQAPLAWQDAYAPEDDFLTSLEESHRQLLEDALVTVTARYPELTIDRQLVHGTPAWALLDAAREAGLLVVGNHGLSGVSRFLLGSVSHTVVLNIVSPTIVVRHDTDK